MPFLIGIVLFIVWVVSVVWLARNVLGRIFAWFGFRQKLPGVIQWLGRLWIGVKARFSSAMQSLSSWGISLTRSSQEWVREDVFDSAKNAWPHLVELVVVAVGAVIVLLISLGVLLWFCIVPTYQLYKLYKFELGFWGDAKVQEALCQPDLVANKLEVQIKQFEDGNPHSVYTLLRRFADWKAKPHPLIKVFIWVWISLLYLSLWALADSNKVKWIDRDLLAFGVSLVLFWLLVTKVVVPLVSLAPLWPGNYTPTCCVVGAPVHNPHKKVACGMRVPLGDREPQYYGIAPFNTRCSGDYPYCNVDSGYCCNDVSDSSCISSESDIEGHTLKLILCEVLIPEVVDPNLYVREIPQVSGVWLMRSATDLVYGDSCGVANEMNEDAGPGCGDLTLHDFCEVIGEGKGPADIFCSKDNFLGVELDPDSTVIENFDNVVDKSLTFLGSVWWQYCLGTVLLDVGGIFVYTFLEDRG
jgi:hypothetical protein